MPDRPIITGVSWMWQSDSHAWQVSAYIWRHELRYAQLAVMYLADRSGWRAARHAVPSLHLLLFSWQDHTRCALLAGWHSVDDPGGTCQLSGRHVIGQSLCLLLVSYSSGMRHTGGKRIPAAAPAPLAGGPEGSGGRLSGTGPQRPPQRRAGGCRRSRGVPLACGSHMLLQ